MNFNFNPEHTFFTSDTHFNHANIIRFCNCPFKDVEQMNETLIANWNRVVGMDDTVFHLGDFCLGGAAEWTKVLDRLNGKIYLIMGNHDLKNLRQGFINRFEHVAMQMHIRWANSESIYATTLSSALKADTGRYGNSSDMCIPERTIQASMQSDYSTSTLRSMT